MNFYVIYLIRGLILWYWADGRKNLYSFITLRIRFDSYSVSFYVLLGLVGLSVGTWSYYYMDKDPEYGRFILLLIAFLISMVLLIFFSNLFMTLIGWDGLGVTSFLLVIFYKNRKSLGSGMITALTNRLGDCILLCCLGLFMLQGSQLSLAMIICLSMTKRAQFPFSS